MQVIPSFLRKSDTRVDCRVLDQDLWWVRNSRLPVMMNGSCPFWIPVGPTFYPLQPHRLRHVPQSQPWIFSPAHTCPQTTRPQSHCERSNHHMARVLKCWLYDEGWRIAVQSGANVQRTDCWVYGCPRIQWGREAACHVDLEVGSWLYIYI